MPATLQPRTVKRLHPALPDDIGDLRTRRPLPSARLEQIDPFLFLNHHGPQIYPPNNRGLPFGPHPHRGFETVTFILEGELAHRDSGGHESIIHAGGVQWMTAGRGIVHAEVSPAQFRESGGPLEILQLWVNLPACLKMSPPQYVGLQAGEIPVYSLDDGRVRVHLIAGDLEDHRGPVRSLYDVHLMMVALGPGGRVLLPAPPGRAVFLYVVRGAVRVGDTPVAGEHLVEVQEDGDVVAVTADAESFLLYGHAAPTREPVIAYGPFVMNTPEEIQAAISDYQAGRFGEI